MKNKLFFRLYSHHGLVGFAGLFLSAQVSHTFSITSTGFFSLIDKIISSASEVNESDRYFPEPNSNPIYRLSAQVPGGNTVSLLIG